MSIYIFFYKCKYIERMIVYICNIPFSNYYDEIKKMEKDIKENYKICLLPDEEKEEMIDKIGDDIIVTLIKHPNILQNHKNNIFKNDKTMFAVFYNKSIFTLYMIKKHPEFIPTTYYVKYTHTDMNSLYDKMDEANDIKLILKPAIDYGGNNIKIVNKNYIDREKDERDIVISEYIYHKNYFTGHFLIIDGIIIKNIILTSSNEDENKINIKCGPITNYTIFTDIYDDSIFHILFKETFYSGFACADFILVDNKPIIFEINPRVGGSLIRNHDLFHEFIEKIIELKSVC